jgi:hypothetical protein
MATKLMDVHWMTADTLINASRLFIEYWKLRRDKFKDTKAPERIEQIIIEIKQEEAKGPKLLEPGDVENRIISALEPADAAIIKSDLELLNLLVLPSPNIDMFDYWGMLNQLVAGLKMFAIEKRIFDLRGSGTDVGQAIPLERTTKQIISDVRAKHLAIAFQRESVDGVRVHVGLASGLVGFPLRVVVFAGFDYYSGIAGYSGTNVEVHQAVYGIECGQRPHWLKFSLIQGDAHFRREYEFMLTGSDFLDIANALRDDIHAFALELNADERKITPLFQQIQSFTKLAGN